MSAPHIPFKQTKRTWQSREGRVANIASLALICTVGFISNLFNQPPDYTLWIKIILLLSNYADTLQSYGLLEIVHPKIS